MKSSLCFLLAAKHAELSELQRLSQSIALARSTAALVHELQRERGLSNLWVGQARMVHAAPASELHQQTQHTDHWVAQWLHASEALITAPSAHAARLLSRVAYALQGLDALALLRARVAAKALDTRGLSADYARLIASLLAVVFEAADSASAPELLRPLVALFHLMQGKEWAGQERAAGAALFASAQVQAQAQLHLRELIEVQQRCLEVFESFASAALLPLWQERQRLQPLSERSRLRRLLLQTPAGGALEPQLSGVWFACCSQCMDQMRPVEDQLTQTLVDQASACMVLVQAEIEQLEQRQRQNPHARSEGLRGSTFFETSPPALQPAPQGLAFGLERSVLDLVQEQGLRLQAAATELETLRASLNERKLIERAKGLLMAHQQLDEPAAHKALRDLAMSQNKRMVDVAEAVLAMSHLLAPRR
ncbi:MAG: nitrate- and nitrite sensing domain-containing protein [Serpentinimonas sp.]|nr:MAG: hypothetical protein JM57_12850 [Comamonadaceae bacterium BICA1-1]MDO9612135.1 nitrate- and nitrite sensing domain-containing protein [Serpentinimonas sp.]